mgnify:FL=1|jgi:hypothetical protein
MFADVEQNLLKSKMIYKDLLSPLDTETLPANRVGEVCNNCGEGYFFHIGWSCEPLSNIISFKEIDPKKRYETDSMYYSINILPKQNVIKIAYDSSNWKAWAHNIEGDCPCGINKKDCNYHKFR